MQIEKARVRRMPYKTPQHNHGGDATLARLGETWQAQKPVEDVGYGRFCGKVEALWVFASGVRASAVNAAELGGEVAIASLDLKSVVDSTGYVAKKLNT